MTVTVTVIGEVEETSEHSAESTPCLFPVQILCTSEAQ